MTPPAFTVLIADDEPAARRGVRQLLEPYSAFTVAGECRNGAEVLARLDALRPDVIFLDIAMPGIDGFEVIRRRSPDRMPATVFLTAYDQFAIKAFEAQALDYLVKPVTEARFAATIKRLAKQLRAGVVAAAQPRIAVNTGRGLQFVPVLEIDWIEAADNYVRLWVGTRSYLLRESLQAIESRVRELGFVRAHRQALVRLDGVREVMRGDGGSLVAVLASGARIPVSRRKRAAFARTVRSHRP